MKQRIFMMLAAMLLSIGAFAQSGNQPLKGDVNEDGRVDVADIVAIVDIIMKGGSTPQPKTYYWFADESANEINENNYTQYAAQISDISDIPSSGSITGHRNYVYFVMPETKTITSLMSGMFNVTLEPEILTADGHKIYKTVSKVNGTITYTIE